MVPCFLAPQVIGYLLGVGGACDASLGSLKAADPEPMAFTRYLAYFAMTLSAEAPAYYWFWRRQRAEGPVASFAALLLCVNLATHPLVVFGLPQFAARAGWTVGGYYGAAEAFAFAFEGLMLAQVFGFPPGRAAAAAVLANLCSWWGGAVLVFACPSLVAG